MLPDREFLPRKRELSVNCKLHSYESNLVNTTEPVELKHGGPHPYSFPGPHLKGEHCRSNSTFANCTEDFRSTNKYAIINQYNSLAFNLHMEDVGFLWK